MSDIRARVRAERWRSWRIGLLLCLLPVLLVLCAFVLPIGAFLTNAVDNRLVGKAFPQTLTLLENWDEQATPDDATFSALAGEIAAARADRSLGAVSARLDQSFAGFRAMLTRTGRAAKPGMSKADIIALEPKWGTAEPWLVLRREGAPLTTSYLLATADLRKNPAGSIVAAPAEEALYVEVIGRTVLMAVIITAITLLLAFPVAYLLTRASPRMLGLLLAFVLLPFWTSLLVRTTAWSLLLDNKGMINALLMQAGLISAPIKLMYNRLGVYIAMVYVSLPFMILPIYASMKAASRDRMRAASALGASPLQAFGLVYLPEVKPGIVAGCTAVAVLAAGFYITPLMIGGPKDQMLSYFIAFFVNESLNWGFAAALALTLILLVAIMLLAMKQWFGLQMSQMR